MRCAGIRRILVLGCLGTALLLGMGQAADEKAEELIRKARRVVMTAKSLEAEQTTTIEANEQKEVRTGTVRLMKPNFWRLKLTSAAVDLLMVSDGKTVFIERGKLKEYQRFPFAEGRDNMPFGPFAPPRAFFQPETIGAGGEAAFAGVEQVNGKTYQVVRVAGREQPKLRKLYFGESGLLEGAEMKDLNDSPVAITVWWKNVKLDPPLRAEDFAYTPPADFKQVKPEER